MTKNQLPFGLIVGAIVAASAAIPASTASAQPGSTVLCESHEYRYARCETPGGGDARLISQQSQAPCIRGETWGYKDRAIWVDRGCAGEFEIVGDRRGAGPQSYPEARPYQEPRRTGYYDDRADNRHPPNYVRDPDQRLYEVPVTSVRAVVGPPEQRCWIEREQVVNDNRGGPNVGGAIAGAVIGGVLGHQIGSGRGNDIATAGGAVAGAAIGANVDRGGQAVYGRDVQRCASAPRDARPDYWEVTYNFRGLEHRVQLSAPPGPTITVDREGEPR